ncbi:hypothetical protein LCGC14_1842690 [marine sediment metagenome]|uniref:Uncharacterized protein n=1 Tax=marine sediment metagenome TaxID=412755 RepID=A0A0F9H0Y3_9ZZZZ
MTFYLDSQEWDVTPRFGDVLRGAILSESDFTLASPSASSYKLIVQQPDYAAILTPCCSIDQNTVLLAPLERVPKNWLKYSHWIDDFTIINRRLTHEEALGSEQWAALEDQRKIELLQKGAEYQKHPFFAYAPSDLLPCYTYTYRQDDHRLSVYLINFMRIFRIKSSAFQRDQPLPLGTKMLQLSIEARTSLRSKLVHYFNRQAYEDRSGQVKATAVDLQPPG